MFFFFSAHTLVLFLCASAAVRAVGRESKCSRRKGITTAAASAQQRRSVTAGWFGSYCCFSNAFETSGIKKKTCWDSWIPVSLSCVRFSHKLVLIPASLCVLFFFRTPCWTWNSRWALRWGGGEGKRWKSPPASICGSQNGRRNSRGWGGHLGLSSGAERDCTTV